MRDTDFDSFAEVLDAVSGMLSRGSYVPNATSTAVFFRALAGHELDAVRRAFEAHVKDPQRGRFVPVPADILAQLEASAANDGRPGPEEAWALALRGDDEGETLVWSAETSTAWGIARPVLLAGDEVGARMAFREAYNRLVETARAERRKVVWNVSLGHDPERRSRALEQAVNAGQLPAPTAAALLPPPETFEATASPEAVQVLQQIRAGLVQRMNTYVESPDAIAKRETAAAQGAIAQRVAEYQRGAE